MELGSFKSSGHKTNTCGFGKITITEQPKNTKPHIISGSSLTLVSPAIKPVGDNKGSRAVIQNSSNLGLSGETKQPNRSSTRETRTEFLGLGKLKESGTSIRESHLSRSDSDQIGRSDARHPDRTVIIGSSDRLFLKPSKSAGSIGHTISNQIGQSKLIDLGPNGMGIVETDNNQLELLPDSDKQVHMLRHIFSLCQQSFRYDQWYLRQSLKRIWLLCYEEIEELFYGLKYNNLTNLKEEIGDVLMNLFLFIVKADKEGIVDMETVFKIMVTKLNARASHILRREDTEHHESEKIWEDGKINTGYLPTGSKGKLTMSIFDDGPGVARYRGTFVNTTPRKKDKKNGKPSGNSPRDTGWSDYVLTRFRDPVSTQMVQQGNMLVNAVQGIPDLQQIILIGVDPVLLPLTKLNIPVIVTETHSDLRDRWNHLSTIQCSDVNIVEIVTPKSLVIVWGSLINKTNLNDRKMLLSWFHKLPKGTMVWCLYQNIQYTILNHPEVLLSRNKHSIVECLNNHGYLIIEMPGHRVDIVVITPKAAQDEFQEYLRYEGSIFFHGSNYHNSNTIANESDNISEYFLLLGSW